MKKVIFCALAALLFGVQSNDVKATHAAGIDISYECIGAANDSFRVVVTFYRDCGGSPLAPPLGNLDINISSASCGLGPFFATAVLVSSTEIIPYCPFALPTECTTGNPSDPPSREQYIYVDTVVLPALCIDWIFSYGIANRNNAITTISPTTVPIYAEATLNNTISPCNSSPFFTNPPAPFVYAGQNYCYNNGAVDLNGDSLVYSLITPRTGPLASDTVDYDPPFTKDQFLTSVPPITLDPVTGDICMTPIIITDSVTVFALLVEEYRFGTFVGSVIRDIQVNVITGTDILPSTNGIDASGNYSDTIAAGCAYTFFTNTSDTDVPPQCLSLVSNVAVAIPLATFTVPPGCLPTGVFNWTPLVSDISNTPKCFVTRLRDDACPVNGEEYKAWCFTVREFTANFTSSAPACVQENVNFYSQYNYSGYSYVWDFGQDAIYLPPMVTSPNPAGVRYGAPGAKTVILTIQSPSGCFASDTSVITINPAPVASFTNSAPACVDEGVDFVNAGSSGVGVTYSWDFGSGSSSTTSTAENPSGVTYTTAGDKVITLNVTNQFGCISTRTDTIVINPTPTVGFSSTAPGCTDSPVDFVNTGTTGASLYEWSFGSGSFPDISIDENPIGIVYFTDGIKSVKLVTTLGACIDSSMQTINITETPPPGILGILPACEGTVIDFDYFGISGFGWTFDWDFGAGASPAASTAEDPVGIVYSGAGPKTVTLTVTNGICSEIFTEIPTIDPTPVADFTSTAPSCTGDSVDFANTGTSGATYLWDFGSGASPAASTAENPTGIIYLTDGIKTVSLTTTLGLLGCVDASVQTINITETPAPGFALIADTCEGATIDFTYTGTTDTNWTYQWDFGTGANPPSSTIQNPLGITYTVPGSKTVTLTVTNGLCTEVFVQTHTILQTPVADFTSTAPACTGDSVDFANTGTTGATSYDWAFDVGGVSATPATFTGENPPKVVYSTAGIKTVRLITTLALGSCTDISIQTINITETPAPGFALIADACEGTAIDFTYTGTTDTNWTYQWDFGVGASPPNSTIQNPLGITYTGPGSKTVTLTVANGICTEVFVQTHTILQTPVADFTSTAPSCTGDSVDFANTGTMGATSYDWAFDVGGVSATPATFTGENPPRVVYLTEGIKTVRLITTLALGSCTDISIQTINITETPAPSFALIADTCEGIAIDFTYTGTTDTNWTYQWDFGVGASPPSSTVQNPLGITYTGPGSKTVTLTVANGMCTEVFAQTHTILQTPVADFTSTAPTCTGDTVDFANTGTTGATSYNWDFGLDASPATSTNENPTGLNGVAYTTAGIKTVTLITTLGTCVDVSIQTININQTPSVSFSSTIPPPCAGEGVDFTNAGSFGGDWAFAWDFGAGAVPATSTAENPAGIIYSYGGTKTVTFTITDGICLNTSTGSIVIYSLPIADAGPDTTICADQSVQIGNPSLGDIYSWFPSSTLDNPIIANPWASPIATITTYIVTVTGSNGCKNVDSVVVTMVMSALVDAGPDVEICFGDAVQIGSALVEGQTYIWRPAAGLDDTTLSNPIASPDITTLYRVEVRYEGCDSIIDDVLVTVHPLPNAKATDSQGRDTTYITLGSSVQLIATGGMQYEWTPETGLDFADIYNPVASPDSTTIYVAAVTDLFGCVNRDTVRVEVDSLTFFIPTAFTPDGNGVSDIFFVRIAEVVDFELIIFDRWGEQLFISRDVFTGWDGTKQDSGKELPEGAYVYSFNGTTADGKEITENGIINLIR